jgi:hypothetical protein
MRIFLCRFPARGGVQLFALLCAMMAGAQSLHAATIIVTTTADSGAGSLRDAIAAASDGDTIQFAAALNGQTISLTSGELAIDKNITISGAGHAFHGGGVLNDHATLTLVGCAVQNNQAQAGGGVYNDGLGGSATLNIFNTTVSGNI